MLLPLIERVAETYRAPRPAMRRVLNGVTGFRDVGLLFALSYCLNSAVIILVSLFASSPAEDGADRPGAVAFVLTNLVFTAAAFALVTALVWRVGRALGGQGSLLDIAAAVAWHSLVTVIFAPVIAAAMVSDPGSSVAGILVMAQLAMVIVVMWLLANFVAEAHRFASAWRVAGVLFAGMFFIAFALSIAVSGFISPS